MSVKLACPAAAVVHPVLSMNKDDIECGVSGSLRPAIGSPCINPFGYPRCSTWKLAKQMEEAHRTKQLQNAKTPHSHTLQGVERD